MKNEFATPMRSKSDPKNKVQGEELFTSGGFTYRLRLDFAKWPEEFKGYQVCGSCYDGSYFYVSTRCPECPIAVFDREGRFIKALGADLPRGRMHGIWKDRRGRLLVADDGCHVVRCLDKDGRILDTVGQFNCPSDTGFDSSVKGHLAYLTVTHRGEPFNKPTRMVEGADGCYYASDGYGNAAVHKFDADFHLLKSWGRPGTGPGEFSIVHSIRTDSRGRVLVSDRDNDRVQIFDGEGNYLDSLEGLLYPCDLDTDGTYIYVAENDGRISIFSMNLELLAQFGHSGSQWRGHSITVDETGNIYLGILHGNDNFVKFEKVATAIPLALDNG